MSSRITKKFKNYLHFVEKLFQQVMVEIILPKENLLQILKSRKRKKRYQKYHTVKFEFHDTVENN